MTGGERNIGIGLQMKNVTFGYDGNGYLFEFSAAPGEIVAVAGPSGSGKSTLLNLIAGFEYPDSGQIFAGGMEITEMPPSKRPVSMLFQENNLFGHLNVEDNVILGVAPNLRPSGDQIGAARNALVKTGLSGKERRLPSELSGGERQRVALARALIRRRPILLLDEPFASLGPALRHQMLDLVRLLHDETRMTILFVSHHPEDVTDFADSYIFLSERRIVASGDAASMAKDEAPDAVRAYLRSETKPQ
jgi:thiamine transport system ATP-binding protein